jgi:hypothetical protein
MNLRKSVSYSQCTFKLRGGQGTKQGDRISLRLYLVIHTKTQLEQKHKNLVIKRPHSTKHGIWLAQRLLLPLPGWRRKVSTTWLAQKGFRYLVGAKKVSAQLAGAEATWSAHKVSDGKDGVLPGWHKGFRWQGRRAGGT